MEKIKKQPLTAEDKIKKLQNQISRIKNQSSKNDRKERAKLLINLGLYILAQNGKTLEDYKPAILQFIAQKSKKVVGKKVN